MRDLGGDSSGDAYLNGKLVGVTSTALDKLTTFADVAAHRDFIDRTIRD